MGERYYRWLELMAERDAILLPLAMIATSLVLSWLLVQYLVPARFQRPLQVAYLVGGAALYIFALVGQ